MRRSTPRTFFTVARILPAIGLAVIISSFAPAARAAVDPDAEELKYVDGLNALGLSHYANMVLEKIKGDGGGRKVVSQIKGLVGVKKFDEANALIAKQPEQDGEAVWSMKLTVADGYYNWGMYSNAQTIYVSFFAKYPDGPPEALNKFYSDSAYKYAQMMKLTGQDEAAIAGYRFGLKVKNIERGSLRQMKIEMAELMVKLAASPKTDAEKQKALFAEATQIANDILWVQDVWFGKGIVILAHIKMLQNDFEGAQKLVDEYWPMLKDIDAMLKQDAEQTGEDIARISPMAECRFMLGTMMEAEADKAIAAGEKDKAIEYLSGKAAGVGRDGKAKRTDGSLQHFYAVFANYSSTAWAPEAGARARKAQETLEGLGLTIKINIDKKIMDKIQAVQLGEARSLFNQQQWVDAAEAYVRVINLFGEAGETTIIALGDLALCYLEIPDEQIFCEMVVRHIGQRFGGSSPMMQAAGDQVLKMAAIFNDRKMNNQRDETYQLYFDFFPNHTRASMILMSFAQQRFQTNDFQSALEYCAKVEAYSNSVQSVEALRLMASCYNELQDKTNEVATLENYVDKLQKKEGAGIALLQGRYKLASGYRALGGTNIVAAINRFNEIIKTLSDPKHPYQRSAEEKETSNKILEGAMYGKAWCYAALNKPEQKLAEYRQNAIDGYSALVTRFPKSDFAPGALSQIGTIYMGVLKNPDKAQEYLNRLQKEYKDSKEARMVDYMMGKALLELNRREEAIKAFKRMFEAGNDKYNDIQIFNAGDELVKAGEYEIAQQAFARVLTSGKEPALKERALLYAGKSLVEVGNGPEAAKMLESLFKQYPRSPYTIEAASYLSRAYTELGAKEVDAKARAEMFNKAVRAMNQARKYEKDPVGLLKLDLWVARIFMMRATAEAKMGSEESAKVYKSEAGGAYQSIVLLNKPEKNPGFRPFIEDAYHEWIPLLVEDAQWADVNEQCEKYLLVFKGGRYESDIRKWRSKARMNVGDAGVAAATENEAVELPPETPPEAEGAENAAEEAGAETAKPEQAEAAAPAPDAAKAVVPASTNKPVAVKKAVPAQKPAAVAKPSTNAVPKTVPKILPKKVASTNAPAAKAAAKPAAPVDATATKVSE